MAQDGEDRALGDEHARLRLGFVARLAHAGGQNRRPVVRGKLRVGRIDLGIVAAGPTHAGAKIVGNERPRGATKIRERPHMRANPARQLLAEARFGEGKVGQAPDADEELGQDQLAGIGIGEVKSVAVVDENLLASAVLLAELTRRRAELRDEKSTYFRKIPMYTLGDMADGYLFLGPLDVDRAPARMRDFVTEATFLKWRRYFNLLYRREFASVGELNELLVSNPDTP